MSVVITRKSDRRRSEIITAAIRHFNRSGLSGATLSAIAASVGLVTNGVVYYYKRKEDLAAACMVCSLDDLYDSIIKTLDEPDPLRRLQLLCEAWFARLSAGLVGDARPVMVFNDIRAFTSPQSDLVNQSYNNFFVTVRRVFDGTPISADPVARNARTHFLLSVLHAAQEWFPEHYEPQDHSRVAIRLSQILAEGLGGTAPVLTSDLPSLDGDGDDIYQAYLRVVTRLINQHGYPGASVERISSELNLTKGSFYHHIDAKNELVTACFERTFSLLRQGQNIGFSSLGTGAERLAITLGALLTWQLSEAGPMLRISAYNSLPEAIRPRFRQVADRLISRFAWQINEAQTDGSMPVRDQMIGARVVDSMLNAVIELEWWVSASSFDEAFSVYTDALTHGLFAPLASSS